LDIKSTDATGWHYLNFVPTLSACTLKVNNKVTAIDLGPNTTVTGMHPYSFGDLITRDYFYVYCSTGDTIPESKGVWTNPYDLELSFETLKGYYCSRMAVFLLFLNHSIPDIRNLHEFRREGVPYFLFSIFLKLQTLINCIMMKKMLQIFNIILQMIAM
jgi:hypothetical protein